MLNAYLRHDSCRFVFTQDTSWAYAFSVFISPSIYIRILWVTDYSFTLFMTAYNLTKRALVTEFNLSV